MYEIISYYTYETTEDEITFLSNYDGNYPDYIDENAIDKKRLRRITKAQHRFLQGQGTLR